MLRHTICTHFADAGANVGTIRELAGHADIRTTTIYTAVNDGRLEHAITERTHTLVRHHRAPTASSRPALTEARQPTSRQQAAQ